MKMNDRIPASIRHLIRSKRYLVWNRPDLYIVKPHGVTSKTITNQILDPLLQWMDYTPGSRAELFRRFNALVTVNIPLIMVTRWTNRNPDKRTEPPYGYGVLLIKIIQDLQDEASHPQSQPLEDPTDIPG
jgi:hypothetical protein